MREIGDWQRLLVLEACAIEPSSPKTLSNGFNLSAIAYHFRVLLKDGLIRKTRTRRVRGALQTYYAPTAKGRRLLDQLGLGSDDAGRA